MAQPQKLQPVKQVTATPKNAQKHYDNAAEDMSEASQMRQNFNEAFNGDTTGVSQQPNYDRMGQLEEQVKEMRAKFKKEETQRKQYQDYARRKDEEIKKFHNDVK